jgi:predicted acetyltransferase
LTNARLVLPSAEYRESFIAANKEYQNMGEEHEDIAKLEADFTKYLEMVKNHRLGLDLPENWVPYTTFWLVEGDEYIGSGHVRHALTPALRIIGGHIGYFIRPSYRRKGYGTLILKLLLAEAAKLGIANALVTCFADNTGSKKVIEANGGVFIGEIVGELDGVPRKSLRYRVYTGLRNNVLWNNQRRWYHGSPYNFSILRAGSTITQNEELARAFSHQPTRLSIDDDGKISHNGTEPGFLYVIDEPIVPGEDIYMHPRTTMDPGLEWLTVRGLKVRLK